MSGVTSALRPLSDRLATAFAGPAPQVLPDTRMAGPMVWVIAIMAALTVMATGAALALARFASQAQSGLEGGVTVQIVEADRAGSAAQARRAEAALRSLPGVTEVRVVPEEELERLVKPWLGTAAEADELAMPALIDVRLASAADDTMLARLRAVLAKVAPAARVDAQADWLGPVFDAARALRWLAFLLIGLLTLASAAAVWRAVRNALYANRETIEIIHHLGAGDDQIARIFQRSVLRDAIAGGLIGLAVGVAALLLIGARFAALQSGMVGSGALTTFHWLLVALVPVIMAWVAVATARRTVLARLGRML